MREDFMWMREHDSDEGDEVVTQTVVRDGKLVTEAIQPPATPQEPEPYGPFFDPCGKCVTRTHCAHHDRCLAECVPADLRASTPSPEGQTWQPIETAPKDGRRVLVMWEYWSSEPFVAYFKHGRWNGEVALSECSDDGPTHWMPLPSPPTPEGTQP